MEHGSTMNASPIGDFRGFVDHALPIRAFFRELLLQLLLARGLFRRITTIYFDFGEKTPQRTDLTRHLRFCAGLFFSKAHFEPTCSKLYRCNTRLVFRGTLGVVFVRS